MQDIRYGTELLPNGDVGVFQQRYINGEWVNNQPVCSVWNGAIAERIAACLTACEAYSTEALRAIPLVLAGDIPKCSAT